jgi:hypothetical protein
LSSPLFCKHWQLPTLVAVAWAYGSVRKTRCNAVVGTDKKFMRTESFHPSPQHGVSGMQQKTARGVHAQSHVASRAARGPSPMEATLGLYRRLFANRAYVRSLSQGVAFLAASMIAIFAAVTFATSNDSCHVRSD